MSRTKVNADHAGLSQLLDQWKEFTSLKKAASSLSQNNSWLTAQNPMEITDAKEVS